MCIAIKRETWKWISVKSSIKIHEDPIYSNILKIYSKRSKCQNVNTELGWWVSTHLTAGHVQRSVLYIWSLERQVVIRMMFWFLVSALDTMHEKIHLNGKKCPNFWLVLYICVFWKGFETIMTNNGKYGDFPPIWRISVTHAELNIELMKAHCSEYRVEIVNQLLRFPKSIPCNDTLAYVRPKTVGTKRARLCHDTSSSLPPYLPRHLFVTETVAGHRCHRN